MPLSILVSNLIKFGLQFLIFLSVWFYYLMFSEASLKPHWELMWILPLLIIIMAGLGLGVGLFISSLTTKYRDLTFLVGFGVQLLMYASSVVLPISSMSERTKSIMLLNPLTSIIEAFKYIFIGSGAFEINWILYSFCVMMILVLGSLITTSLILNSIHK